MSLSIFGTLRDTDIKVKRITVTEILKILRIYMRRMQYLAYG